MLFISYVQTIVICISTSFFRMLFMSHVYLIIIRMSVFVCYKYRMYHYTNNIRMLVSIFRMLIHNRMLYIYFVCFVHRMSCPFPF